MHHVTARLRDGASPRESATCPGRRLGQGESGGKDTTMRLVRYQAQGRRPLLGLLENGQVYDLEATSGGRAAGGDMRALLSRGQQVIDEVASAARAGQPVPEGSVALLAPISNPGKLIAVAG